MLISAPKSLPDSNLCWTCGRNKNIPVDKRRQKHNPLNQVINQVNLDQGIVNKQQIHCRLLRCGSYKHLASNKSDQPQKLHKKRGKYCQNDVDDDQLVAAAYNKIACGSR